MKKKYPIYIDETAILYDTIAVSAGQRGIQVLVNPNDIVRFTHATIADLTKEVK